MTKFKSIWLAVATRFRDYAPELIFEIVNEPYFELSAAEMDTLNSEIIPIIRATGGNNAYRNLILVGGGENSYLAPQQINPTILSGDSNLIATFHYYDPFKFTEFATGPVRQQHMGDGRGNSQRADPLRLGQDGRTHRECPSTSVNSERTTPRGSTTGRVP